MLIRIGSKNEMERLWGDSSSPTLTYFVNGIETGNLVKMQNIDYHYIDKNNKPVRYEIPYALYLNKL